MPAIFKWKCSYYCNCHKKWQYGYLTLSIESIKFKPDGKRDQNKKLPATVIKLQNIIELKKTTTSLVFNAMTIKDSRETHWLSSFSNVYDVVATIEHFWREKLLGPEHSNSSARHKNDIFNLLYDSQDTLQNSAKQLHAQGQQLRAASGKVTSIANDLGIAENFVSDLESWLGVWKTSKARRMDLCVAPLNECSDTFRADYAILLAQTQQESHQECILSFSDDMLIKNKELIVLYSFNVHEISSIIVHSPWDLSLTKAAIGRKNISLHIISTRLPFILATLEKVYRYKPIYEDPPSDSLSEDDDNEKFMDLPAPLTDINHQEITTTNLDRRSTNARLCHPEVKTASSKDSTYGGQYSRQRDVVSTTQMSEDDASEISALLKNMKMLALDIGTEQGQQLQEIEDLTRDIDRTNMRVVANNQRVKKLM